jgi:hypothetical protein
MRLETSNNSYCHIIKDNVLTLGGYPMFFNH